MPRLRDSLVGFGLVAIMAGLASQLTACEDDDDDCASSGAVRNTSQTAGAGGTGGTGGSGGKDVGGCGVVAP